MFGNYPVNDDWVFFWQVKAFSLGIFNINAELDPSFIAQGFLGLLWSKIFGLDYISLQVLTFLISLGTAFFVYKTLRLLGSRKIFAIAGALTLFFNPLFFVSSFTFMTDNYLLFFLSGATYFFIRYFTAASYRNLIAGSFFAMLAAATRQNGTLIFLPATVLCAVPFQKEKLKKLLIPVFFFLLSIAVAFFWPRFGANKRFLETEDFAGRLQTFLYVPQYLLIFLSPVFLGIRGQLNGLWRKAVVFVIAVPVAYLLFKTDLFPMGNMLYIEELYAKSDFRANFSLFDNIFTKLFLAFVWGLGFSKILFYLLPRFRKIADRGNLRKPEVFILFAAALNFGVLLFSSDMYDRYLLPGFLFSLLFVFGRLGAGYQLNKYCVYLSILLLMVISVALQWDFSARNRLMWKQLENLRQKTGMSTQIDFNDTYINHITVRESGDFTGLESRRGSFDPLCFIQDYTLDSSFPFSKKVESLGRVISSKGLENPKPLGVRKKTLPRIKNNLDSLTFNEEYPSVLYGLVGKKAYVGSFCVESAD
ncbi:hypothetical protein A2380_03505 [candidate division WWE3 bacterium RIFOXYB1_FULL_43_24]|uniref:ArnT-like N-terminal domain-containing protein n=2 Tax=Katanobacteria TaxID=422282 RepID=A0A0G0YQC2_UNCKA|nr:MAG: hypothetical protein UU92_C0006G0015 [candidate division WWE3 bacterium GW2011_GWA1_42_12]KKS34366.1 MAG: hypothetical protein UU97_C0011G0002 [candidate division WWE3 bacterium GW2011_GWD1_42_14]KKS38860.1 MAG: hypothetical protein UV00_C0005G0043 [candidate division WWE3 bacterium GW2011_GWF1_42_14]KKS40558.1 MAG: hypothetical protein UV03_C0005G0044 [candidate division WWE3 bacterium GW2011_GWE1_42_16]KKS66933.1 MAG: hypothetical protein UV35_C0005G0014 [candidate division WWE3 bacte